MQDPEINEEEHEFALMVGAAEYAKQILLDEDYTDLLTTASQINIIENLVTFENSNHIAYLLAMSKPTVARALYNELEYWASNNQI